MWTLSVAWYDWGGKFYGVFAVIILVVFTIWIFKVKETTLGEEFPDAIRVENVSEISVIRGSDDKEVVVIEESAKENLLSALLDTEVKESKGNDKDGSEVYWITIKNEKEREFGLRVDDELNVVPYDYSRNEKNSNHYLFSDDKVLKKIESLF